MWAPLGGCLRLDGGASRQLPLGMRAASDERVASRTVLCDERWQREEAGAREEMIEASTSLVRQRAGVDLWAGWKDD